MWIEFLSRIVPVELGQAFLRYLSTTLPTIIKLRFLLHGTPAPDLLFASPNGTPWSADWLGDTIRNATQRNGLGTAVGLMGSRHIQAALAFRLMEKAILHRFITISSKDEKATGLAVEDGDQRVGGLDPFFGDLQHLSSALHGRSNHSAATASVHYQLILGHRMS